LIAGAESELITLRSPTFKEKHPGQFDKQFYDVIFEKKGKRGIFQKAEAYDEACDTLDAALVMDQKGDITFESLVIDATGLSGFAMNKSIELSSGAAQRKLQDEGIMVPSDRDWGGEMSLMSQFISWAVGIDKHVIVITHEWREEKQDRATRERKIISVRPLFIGKNRENIPRMFSNVWNFQTEGKGKGQIFQAQTSRDDAVYARTRFGGLLPLMVKDPNLSKIIDQFRKEVASRGVSA